MEMSNGECELVLQEPTTGLSAPCYSQESTHNYDKEGDQSRRTPHTESCLPSTSQKGVAKCPGAVSTVGEELSDSEKQKLWQIQRDQLEKELYDCTRAHKRSIVQSAYEMSKFQVSFGLVKRQESLAKEQLEDAMLIVSKLQTKLERLQGQLRHTENENRRLSTVLSTLSCELDKRSAENKSLRKDLEAAKRSINHNTVEPGDVVEGLTAESAPIIAQHELQTKQLRKIEKNMETGEGMVTDRSDLERWTVENALHSATSELEELKQKLADNARLESDLTTSKLDLEKVTKEKEELLIRLEAASNELQYSRKRMAEIEMHDVKQGNYSQVIDELNVEKITLMGQLELLRRELEKQNEAARKAQIEANKAMEAERECAKAFKLVEEKEEEMEYYMRQLEVLREKNGMLRTQLDMENQCKEAEMAAMPKVHEQSLNQLCNLNPSTVVLVACKRAQSPEKTPLDPASLQPPEATTTILENQKLSTDDSRHKVYATQSLQESSKEVEVTPITAASDVVPNRESDPVQQPTTVPSKMSSRLRNRASTQKLTDSGSVTSCASKKVIELSDEQDANEVLIEDATKVKKRSSTRVKRPPALLPNGTETSQKRGRKKPVNDRKSVVSETDAELVPAHLLVRRKDLNERAKSVGMPDVRGTPSRPIVTPRSGFRLPR